MQQLTSQRKAEIPHSVKQREQRLTKSTVIPIKDMAQDHSVIKGKKNNQSRLPLRHGTLHSSCLL